MWYGKTVNWFCKGDELVHPIRGNLSRPYARSIVLAAGLEVVEDEHTT